MDSGPNRNRPFFTNNRLLPTAVPSTSKKNINQSDKGSLNMNMSVIDEVTLENVWFCYGMFQIVIDEQDSDAEPLPKKKALCLDNSKGMMFDFSADPKLQSVRNSVLSIIDPVCFQLFMCGRSITTGGQEEKRRQFQCGYTLL